MLNKIKKRISNFAEALILRNYFKTRYQKRVLLCYVIKPYINRSSKIMRAHQNRKESIIVGKVFNELGFKVDIINHDNEEGVERLRDDYYDIIFGRGRAFKRAIKDLDYGASVYYATGLPAVESNRLEEGRVEAVNKKYSTRFKPMRHLPEDEEDFYEFFKAEITGRKNIHMHGWMEIGSENFNSVVKKCAVCILPVIAAGQNGSALTCMAYGLFPIISANCNIDLDKGGILLEDVNYDSIVKATGKYINLDIEEIKRVCMETRENTKLKYSDKNFRSTFTENIRAILSQEERK
jgi:hypothetical protein